MSREPRGPGIPSNYPPRRYQDPRDYEDKRERIYEDKIYDRSERYTPQLIASQSPPNYPNGRYDIRRAQSSTFFDRYSRTSKKYPESQPDRDIQRRSSESQSKKERSPGEYVPEADKISDIIKKEYQVNPPIQLNLAPMLLDVKPWD